MQNEATNDKTKENVSEKDIFIYKNTEMIRT